MKTVKDPEQNILRDLFQEEVPPQDLSLAEDRQRKTIRAIGSVMRQEAQRAARLRYLKFGAGALLLAAATLLLVLRWPLFRAPSTASHSSSSASDIASAGDLTPTTGPATLLRNGRSIDCSLPTSLLDRDEIHAGGKANLNLMNGSRLQLSENTVLQLGSRENPGSLELMTGHVEVEVPKLPIGQSFSIHTSDVAVVVHGTHFSVGVQLDANEKAVISVSVTEGRVSVNRAGSRLAFLDPGQSWSSQSELGSMLRPDSSAEPVASGVLAQKQVVPRANPPENLDGPKSTLAQENRLFHAAVSAARSGHDDTALSLFDQLISRYPNSPLLQQARVERMRCLKRLGRAGP